MQYGAPATEFSGYSDGVYASKTRWRVLNTSSIIRFPRSKPEVVLQEEPDMVPPLEDNYKTGGISQPSLFPLKNNFERRLGIWPPVLAI